MLQHVNQKRLLALVPMRSSSAPMSSRIIAWRTTQ